MSDPTDNELLDRFSGSGCQEAFRQLVDRYLPIVYSVALRKTGSRSAAEDVTQDVFIALAKKAVTLRGRGTVSGWLQRAASLAAAANYRREMRLRRRG